MLKDGDLRYQRVNTCAECGACKDGRRCIEARQELRDYGGIRYTSDGFDCALPVSIDSHSMCSYGCLYCFSDNLMQHRDSRSKPIGQTSISALDRIFSGGGGKSGERMRMALRYHLKAQHNGFPCPVQLGAICDPCDHIERQQGWLLEFIKLVIKYDQPVRISTKGNIFQLKEYQEAIAEKPYLFWIAFSIITPDDELLEQVDRRAPNATQRIKTMGILTKLGAKCSLRFRPMMPGFSDSTPRYPKAYKSLIEKAAQAGAKAISYEVAFAPGSATQDVRWRWQEIQRITGIPYLELYRMFGPSQACMRPPYTWTENIMHAVYEVAHENGMACGVSDPVWKQLTDTGCCCGILPDDPVFGNWERESATNQLLLAKQTGKEIGPDDIIADWARISKLSEIANLGAGPLVVYAKKHQTWADKLREIWNNPEKQRSPLNYFQGALMPTRRDENGDLFYRYVGLERTYPTDTPYWKV